MDPTAHDELDQYLTFRVAGERYAVAILRVREIIPYRGATRVPLTSPAVRGVINLRGSVVPVVDLSVRFQGAETPASKRACVVILDLEASDERSVMGLLVESVDAVIDLPASQIQAAPEFGSGVGPDFLEGMARIGKHFVAVLDVGRVLAPDELAAAELTLPEAAGESSDELTLPELGDEAAAELTLPESGESTAEVSDPEPP
ncbi:MAG: chemotaxis protein CheW [Myxococcota bacterium]|nr:chemotaxis protein CheW [Myxococcota bacterium]